jgi:hypothetical protein
MQAESCGGRRFLFWRATKGCQTETWCGLGCDDSLIGANLGQCDRLLTLSNPALSPHGKTLKRADDENLEAKEDSKRQQQCPDGAPEPSQPTGIQFVTE